MSECGYPEQGKGCPVAIVDPSVLFNSSYSCPDVVEHKAVVLFLLDDLATFLVEDVAHTVQDPVETLTGTMPFVKTEIKFLVFQGIKHICHFFAHLPVGQQCCQYRGDCSHANDDNCPMKLLHRLRCYIFSVWRRVWACLCSETWPLRKGCRCILLWLRVWPFPLPSPKFLLLTPGRPERLSVGEAGCH